MSDSPDAKGSVLTVKHQNADLAPATRTQAQWTLGATWLLLWLVLRWTQKGGVSRMLVRVRSMLSRTRKKAVTPQLAEYIPYEVVSVETKPIRESDVYESRSELHTRLQLEREQS